MLVLSRHKDETIMIGDDIELTIVDIRGDKVRVGIKAPSSVPVHRKEVYEAIRSENERAAAFNGEVPGLEHARGAVCSASSKESPRGATSANQSRASRLASRTRARRDTG